MAKAHTTRLWALAALGALALSLMAAPRKGKAPGWDELARLRKAEYVMLQGITAELEERNDAHYALLEHARSLNAADTAGAFEMGLYGMQLAYDSLSAARAYDMVKRGYAVRPTDFYTTLQTARIANMMADTAQELAAYARLHRLEPTLGNVTRMYAQALVASGRPGGREAAMALFDSLETAEGMSADLALQRVSVLALSNDTAAIIEQGKRLLRAGSPDAIGNHVLMGDIYASFAMPDSALVHYNLACDADTTNAPAAFHRANFYHSIGDSAAFDREIFRVLRMDDLDIDDKLQIMTEYVSELYSDSTQTPRIKELFRAMTDYTPHVAELRSLYGAFLVLNKETEQAVEQMELALDLDPSQEAVWGQLAWAYVQLADYEQAQATLERALGFFPENANFNFLLANLLLTLDRPAAEVMARLSVADSLVDRRTDYELASDIRTLMGDLDTREKLTDEAIANYEMALTLNPYNTGAMNNYAYMLACQDRNLDLALSLIEDVMRDDETQSTWVDTYAWVLYKRGDMEKAREQIDKAIALAYMEAGGDSVAVVDDEPVVADNADVLVAEEPAIPGDLLDHAAYIYEALGLHREARELWEMVLINDPDYEEKETVLDNLSKLPRK